MREKYLVYTIKFLAILSFFTPLLVPYKHFIFPFIVPKIVVLRSLILLMLGIYILLLVTNVEKYKLKLNPVNIVVGLFLVSFGVSTFIGPDWYRSMWDNHERMLGFFTVFHYILYYFILSSVFKEWKDWRFLMRVFLTAGSIVMLIGLWQKFVNPEALLNRNAVRVSATLGNAIYMSGYGLFLSFIGVLLGLKEKKKSFWQWYSFLGAFLGFAGIFLGGTRGTFLGLMAGLLVVVIGYILMLKDHARLRKYLIGLIIAGILVLGISWVYRDTAFINKTPVVGRLVNISLSSGSAETRLMAWEIAVDAWKEKPIIGWGPNNYYYAFNKYYRSEFLEHGFHETWFDNAHSVIFNTLAVQGIFGISFYFGMFLIPIYLLWRDRRKQIHIVIFSSAFLVGHFVHNAFVFENPTSYLYFFFFLAFVNHTLTMSDVSDTKDGGSGKKVGLPIMGIVMFFILLFVYTTNINPARANMRSFDAIQNLSRGMDPVKLFNNAVEIPTPHIDDIRNDFGRMGSQLIVEHIRKDDFDSVKDTYELIYSELKKNIELHPMDIRVHIQLSQLVQFVADATKNATLLFEAEALLEDAHAFSPKRQQVEYILAQIKLRLGKGQEAVEILRTSVDNNYKIAEGWWRLASFHYTLGQKDVARDVVNEAREKGVVFTGQGKKIVDQILLGVTSTK
ncbi:O-antigen ligase family protein [Candidatus Parcubacteria bacterium]|jgi:O-antigen ligase|nr:O-antigen ligase family protein [Candidatus Parcubacteria bacterium]MBT3948979.1 O-antigen ligase family protein [Candidatus Parcubacteria bacterium]